MTDIMQRYPYLAKYNSESQYEDVVLLMLEPHIGRIVYIPPDLTPGDIRLELALLDVLNPATTDIDDYTGSVVLRSNSDPALGS